MTDSSTAPVRRMSIYKQYLRQIATGDKTVEVRVAYPKNRKLAAGDLLAFVSGDETCLTRIVRVSEYSTFEDMLDTEEPVRIGFGEDETRAVMLETIREIYPPEKERLGVLAVEVELAQQVERDA
ncbi:ASCH domain-containing protein [Pseudonocardia acaciae]|uniref:ASCH domain-containing protein n=1 Tax=Pseudonocardia acaciae TaxID=551276 RepID=UPI0004914524|nr:ASCH domain-containing protein [Pseudonocardia acaciae]